MALWLLPFRAVRYFIARFARQPDFRRKQHVSTERVTWAVKTASSYAPLANCLPQALVTCVMLARRGHLAKLRIGVTRSTGGLFQAHAWVESEGRVVIGGARDLACYAQLPLGKGDLL